jgi:hypothetical protein
MSHLEFNTKAFEEPHGLAMAIATRALEKTKGKEKVSLVSKY